MSWQPTVCRNRNGGYYESGKSFTQAKWVFILQEYESLLIKNGKCTVCGLAKEVCTSLNSANHVINLYHKELKVMPQCQRGHGKRDIGSKKGFVFKHHAFMYHLYLNNPSMPLYDGYCKEFYKK